MKVAVFTAMMPGVLTITESGSQKKEAAVLEGFMEITQDKVTILAQSCEWPEEIDVNRAIEARERAERRLKSSDATINISRAELALRKSLIRIELAGRK